MIKFLTLLLLLLTQQTTAETVINYTPLEDPSDKRLEYPLALIKLAMDKTEASYGSYHLKTIPRPLSLSRSMFELKRNTYSNYFILGGANIESMISNDDIESIDFPADQGLLSFRICFVNPNIAQEISNTTTLDELKKYTIGQGSNWPDVLILRANGFHVEEIGVYTSLFKMVSAGRIDLFCRGISELRNELFAYQALFNLTYDKSFAFKYDMPYKFYFNKESKTVISRLREGLKIAKSDGSLEKLFFQFNKINIDFANLKKRKIFKLESPYSKDYSETYRSYLINPINLN